MWYCTRCAVKRYRAQYCSKECQEKAWEVHKMYCRLTTYAQRLDMDRERGCDSYVIKDGVLQKEA
jgi:hypothetical protein